MTKAVFFDWFNTLTTYYPPREDAYVVACHDLGLEVTTDQLAGGCFWQTSSTATRTRDLR